MLEPQLKMSSFKYPLAIQCAGMQGGWSMGASTELRAGHHLESFCLHPDADLVTQELRDSSPISGYTTVQFYKFEEVDSYLWISFSCSGGKKKKKATGGLNDL